MQVSLEPTVGLNRSGYFKTRLLALLFLPLPTMVAVAKDWPRFLGPDCDGVSQETGWSTAWSGSGPKVLWRTEVGTGFSGVSVSKGRVYTMGSRKGLEYVYCLDSESGAEIWSASYPAKLFDRNHEGGPSVTPTVDGGFVYTLGKAGRLCCVAADSGKVVWSSDLVARFDPIVPMYGFCGSPWIEGDKLIVDVGSIVALNKRTGDLIWKSPRRKVGYASPIGFDFNGGRFAATLNAYGRFEDFMITFVTYPFLYRCAHCSARAFYRDKENEEPLCGRCLRK